MIIKAIKKSPTGIGFVKNSKILLSNIVIDLKNDASAIGPNIKARTKAGKEKSYFSPLSEVDRILDTLIPGT